MASDWEEVKKLAADFQLTQTATTLQRLSERNCVEIVKKLAQLNLLDVIYTSDGKEYLTPEHLVREIEDELYAAGGRIGFNELANQLNVDISHIEVKAKECARLSGGEIVYVGDELINKNYKEQLAVEINERIQKRGTLDIGDLTRIYSLSADFLHQIITSHLGTVINAVQDPSNRLNFFTKSYLDQYRAKITGVLSAITRPVSISHLINKYAFPEKMFNNVIDELLRTGRVNGQLTTGSNRTFIPNIYLLTQKEWIENFYKHNGYLEYDALTRVGITEPRALKKRSGFEDLILLSTCCVGQTIFVQVEGALDDCLASKSWMNLADVLPSFLDEDDMKKLIDEYKSCYEDKASTFITLNKTLVISHQFMTESLESLVEAFKAKAERDLKDGVLFRIFASAHSAKDKSSLDTKAATASRKEERKRRGGTKTFSTQGREVKTKSVKKKYKPNQKFDDSDASDNEENLDAPGSVDVSDLLEELKKRIDPDGEHDSEIVDVIAENMTDSVRSKYLDIAREYFASSLTKDSSAQKKTQADLQQAINTLYANINVFWKSLKLFDDELSASLSKYLLRSLCSELVDNAILLVLDDSKKSEKLVFPLTIESRGKLISKLEPNYRDSFSALNATLTESSVENFFTKLEETFEVCDIMIKKLDKKRESVLMSELRQNIIMQINEANQTDYPLILHLSTLLLLWSVKQCMVHASGKFVPQILASLKSSLPAETYELFHNCEQLIVKMVKAGKEASDTKEEIEKKLAELIPSVKAIALNFPPQS